jgi:hypothetical protein
MNRPTPPPGAPGYVTHEEREVDTWEVEGVPYRLLHRAGLYRLEAYHMARWEIVERGMQQVARRVAELLREQGAAKDNVLPLEVRRPGR